MTSGVPCYLYHLMLQSAGGAKTSFPRLIAGSHPIVSQSPPEPPVILLLLHSLPVSSYHKSPTELPLILLFLHGLPLPPSHNVRLTRLTHSLANLPTNCSSSSNLPGTGTWQNLSLLETADFVSRRSSNYPIDRA